MKTCCMEYAVLSWLSGHLWTGVEKYVQIIPNNWIPKLLTKNGKKKNIFWKKFSIFKSSNKVLYRLQLKKMH